MAWIGQGALGACSRCYRCCLRGGSRREGFIGPTDRPRPVVARQSACRMPGARRRRVPTVPSGRRRGRPGVFLAASASCMVRAMRLTLRSCPASIGPWGAAGSCCWRAAPLRRRRARAAGARSPAVIAQDGRDGAEARRRANLDQVPDAVAAHRDDPRRRAQQALRGVRTQLRAVHDDRPFVERGLASWYGRKFQGRRTASGEPYDMYAMTAAHPTLPIPSYARVRNPANGREIVVRVNDRGPFHPGRIIDLSYTAALRLDLLRGVAPVEVERITQEEIRTGAWRRGAARRVASQGGAGGTGRPRCPGSACQVPVGIRRRRRERRHEALRPEHRLSASEPARRPTRRHLSSRRGGPVVNRRTAASGSSSAHSDSVTARSRSSAASPANSNGSRRGWRWSATRRCSACRQARIRAGIRRAMRPKASAPHCSSCR